MKIQDIKNLDLYRCSFQDINKADKALRKFVLKLISSGHATSNNFKGSEQYITAKRLSVAVSRARHGMCIDGYMISNNTIERLPNNKSTL